MAETLLFGTREEFRAWLWENGLSGNGVWLLFGKAGGPKSLKAEEALEEALCFGWIDGQMKSVDATRYIKYFSPRRKGSPWSEKNKALAEKLAAQGAMTERGQRQIEEARRDGRWEAPKREPITEEQVAQVEDLLRGHEPALQNFLAMSPSVRRTYAAGYFAAKTEEGRQSRLRWMIDRLSRNLKPM